MCENCNWRKELEKIEEMLGSDDFIWAQEALEGIHNSIEHLEHCTGRQAEALQNIRGAGERQY